MYETQAPSDEESQRASSSGDGSNGPGQQQQQQESASKGFNAAGLFSNIAHEVRETMMPLENIRSYTRKYKGPVAEAPEGPYTGTAALAVVKQLETPWQKAWSTMQGKVRRRACNAGTWDPLACMHRDFKTELM